MRSFLDRTPLRQIAAAAASLLLASVLVVALPGRAEAAFGISVDPSTGIVDGQSVTVTVTEPPTQWVFVNVCDAAVVADPSPQNMLDACESTDDIYDTQAGPITKTVSETITTWSGRTVHCGVEPQDCVIAVAGSGVGVTAAFAAIDVVRSGPAPAEVTVSPRADLLDGQTVSVTGERIPSTYDGPVRLFPTGDWALTVCRNDVPGSLNLWSVFTAYAVLPPGIIDVPGSTFSAETVVRSQFTATIGGAQVDCSFGSCVVGITRWEQDGTVSGVFGPRITYDRTP